MSHELRTSLNAILGFSELLQRESVGLTADSGYREYVREIQLAGQRLLQLVSNILEVSRLERDVPRLNEEALDIGALLHECVAPFLQQVEARGPALITEFNQRSVGMVLADKVLLARILNSLISNAVKFTPTGGEVRVRAWATAQSGFVIQVLDTGIGIAEKNIPKAFAPFEQISEGRAREYERVGLGLPLAKALVELHGGSLDLQSKVGVGTSVTVRLPAHRVIRQTA